MAIEEQDVPLPEDVLDVFETTDGPVLTANEAADALGVSRRTALRWLKELENEGRVDRKEVGARAVVWWRTGEHPDTDPLLEALERVRRELPRDAPGRTALDDAIAILDGGD